MIFGPNCDLAIYDRPAARHELHVAHHGLLQGVTLAFLSCSTRSRGYLYLSDEIALAQGWLTKLGHVVKNWKRRWFTLSKSHIAYAEDHNMKSIKGTIDLEDGASVTTSALELSTFAY